MRIALVIYGGLERISGGFIYDRALVAALGALGHRIDVIALPWRGYARAVAGSAIARSPPRALAPGTPYDVVIEDELVHPSVAPSVVPSTLARARPARAGGNHDDSGAMAVRIALIHNLRSDQPGERFRALKTVVERRYLGAIDGVIAVCRRTADDVRALAGTALPTLVARPGRDHIRADVDDARIGARGVESGPLRILHAAAVRPHKGLARLLAALARARDRHGLDFTLDVAGGVAPGRYARAIRRQLAAPALATRVRLRGELRGEALRALFRSCQLFALPSDREAYSLACLEALGFGLPVLATSVGGLAEMITDGHDGFLIDPDDTDRWTAQLAVLGAARARLVTMGQAALARYRAHATWREVAGGVQDFLHARLRARGDAHARARPPT